MCKNLYLTCILLCWLWLPETALSQQQSMSVKNFDEGQGFTFSLVSDLYQDSTGFLWLATPEGLVRYDGYQFKTYHHIPGDSTSITSNYVIAIAEDRQGNIWAGLVRGGVSRYDRKTGTFTNYPFTRQLQPPTAQVTSLFFDRDGELWVGVESNGIIRLNTKTGEFEQYNIVTPETAPVKTPEERRVANHPYDCSQDESGTMWLSTRDGLYRFDPETGKAEPQRFSFSLPGTMTSTEAYCLLSDGDLIWVGGWASGLRSFNRKTKEWKHYFFNFEKTMDFITNIVNDIAIKSPDELWVSTQDFGLGVFNKKTGKFFFFAHDPKDFPDMPVSHVHRMLPDNQQNLWILHERNLVRIQVKNRLFDYHEVPVSRSDNLGQHAVSCFFEDREGRFFFTGNYMADGLHVLDKKTGKRTVLGFEVSNKESNILVVQKLLQDRNGIIWVLTRDIIYRFNPETMQLEKPPQPKVYYEKDNTDYYKEIAAGAQGNLWLSSSISGVIKYDPRTGESTQFTTGKGIPANIVGSLAADARGRIWYGSCSQTCLGYYLPAEDRFVYLDAEGKETKVLATFCIQNLSSDSTGNIWVCSEEGMMYFDCSGQRPRLLKKYTVADGLPSNNVFRVSEDAAGNYWMQTPIFISRFDKKSGQISSFGRRDGLTLYYMNFYRGMDGRMYMPALRGYYSFDPATVKKESYRTPLALTSFKIDGSEQYHSSELSPAVPFTVPANSRFFSFEFAALNLAEPELCQYEYRLEGLSSEWVPAGNHRYVTYTNIPAGKYIFQAKLAGAPDGEALAVPLTVRVAFYKTGWFWAAVGLLIASFAGWLYHRRRQHERQVRDLQSKANLLEKEKATVMYESLKQQLNPHFLFNSLTSLGSLIHIDPKAAGRFLDSLSKTYRYILKSSDVETVPLAEELKFAETFVKLQKTRFGEGLQVNFKVGEEDFHRKIVPVTLQNLIENAIKHNIIDEEEPLVVEVFVENACLVVRNNLQRKKFVETSNKRGLANLKSFYKYLSDREIEVVEDGAFFMIKIPLL